MAGCGGGDGSATTSDTTTENTTTTTAETDEPGETTTTHTETTTTEDTTTTTTTEADEPSETTTTHTETTTQTRTIIEDFESGDLSGWTVNTVGGTGNSTVEVTGDNPYEGTYSLDYHGNIRTWIVSTGAGLPYPQRGDSFELRWYYATRGSGGFGFAARSDSFNDGYLVQVRSDTWSKHPDTVTLYRRAGGQKSKQIAQASFDMSAYTGQYLRWTVEWGDPMITITGYTTDGTEIVTLGGNDTTYDQGGIQCEANCTNPDVVYFDAWRLINR